MRHSHCNALVVIDVAGRPVGIITRPDLVDRVVAEGKNPLAHTAEQSMTQAVVTVGEKSSIDSIVDTMRVNRIQHVPVVDDRGVCVGIVTQSDIVRWASRSALPRRFHAVFSSQRLCSDD